MLAERRYFIFLHLPLSSFQVGLRDETGAHCRHLSHSIPFAAKRPAASEKLNILNLQFYYSYICHLPYNIPFAANPSAASEVLRILIFRESVTNVVMVR